MSARSASYATGVTQACLVRSPFLRRKSYRRPFRKCSVYILSFDSLWAVLRLQVIPDNLGGAGAYRIEWEFDDAVFKEAAYVPTPSNYF